MKRNRHTLVIAWGSVLAFFFLLSGVTPGLCRDVRTEEDSLRCGSRVVTLGKSRDFVRRFCGEPSSVRYSQIERGAEMPSYPDYFDPQVRRHPVRPYVIDVIDVEEWTYNFGPGQFMHFLRFENDQLVRIEIGGYGY